MIRTVLLVSACMLATPALAQDMADPATTTPETVTEAPATESTATPPADQAVPADTVDADSATPEAAAGPAAAPSAIAAVVEADWTTFDADKSGELSKTEFGAWMTKLRAGAESADATPAAEYNNAAFAQADADKNSAVTKSELTTFLKG